MHHRRRLRSIPHLWSRRIRKVLLCNGHRNESFRSCRKNFGWSFFSSPISFLLLFMVAFYLLIFLPGQRSSKKAQREQEQMLANLKKNDRVVTSFGVHGVISNISSDSGTVTIRVDENTNAKLTVNRDTIRVVKKD